MITSHLGMHDLDKSVTITDAYYDHPLAVLNIQVENWRREKMMISKCWSLISDNFADFDKNRRGSKVSAEDKLHVRLLQKK